MKLVRFGAPGTERPGIWLAATKKEPARIVDVRAMAFDIEDYDERFWRTCGVERLKGLLGEKVLKTVPAEGVRLGPPVARPRQVICLGKNYRDHAEEFDAKVPDHPVYFAKSPGSLCGAGDPIRLRPGMERVDGEVELALVIGKRARDIQESDALGHVAGYTVMNDVSARDLQKAHAQWIMGKGPDTFAPLGPCLVHKSSIPDPHNLFIRCSINGELRQNANTKDMVFDIPSLIATLSSVVTLEPGDIIATGTPAGVGVGFTPPKFLQHGDEMRCEIEKIGALVNTIEK